MFSLGSFREVLRVRNPWILPLKEIHRSPVPNVIQFREKRLPLWERKIHRT